MQEKINFIYESGENKYLIGNLNKGKLKNKKYFFQSLGKLNFSDNLKVFLQDNKFNFFQKYIAETRIKKITIQDIEKEISSIDIENNVFIGYMITNIKINGESRQHILGEKGEIEYVIGIYTLNKLEYNNILKYFGKNTKLEIYPNSLFLLKEITKDITNGNILYIGNENIEILNIKNSFYYGVEILNLGLKNFTNKIQEIFGKQLTNINELSDFHKKVYMKELENYINPILLFIKNNLKGEKLFTIGDFTNTPALLEQISKKLKLSIIPIKIDGKNFSTIEQANIYCIKKYF